MKDQPLQRKLLVRNLIEQPSYLALSARLRLGLIKKLEEGLDVSAALFHAKVLHWVKTGKFG
ncbi:MAG: hypothetical protein QME75_14635 [Deltaproteobacteria bacterium]|nr:hypothetical protein [Desulfitobacteriaceae bacterium]MDI6854826.1 hypothetical protein [Deltaproteobacteria bacterium]